MRARTRLVSGGALLSLALVVTACSGGSSGDGATDTSGATGGSTTGHRGGTLTMLWSSAGSSIDPATDYDPNWFILRMTNDGLVAWKQVAGASGNDVVPDLATAIPKPTDGGKTYTFTLRKGIAFSDGTIVKPSDVAASLTREFKIPGPGVNMYASLVGASACIATPASCDLSKGVVADDQAGTVTFHLTQPDPDFLQKLALPFSYVVPAGSPDKEVGSTPLPGTGPYMITDYSPNKSMTLERNPHFKQWSADAQPDGYPDTIEMKIGLSDEDAVTEVEQGTADWVYDAPPTDRLGEIADKYPNQIHIDATNIQYYMALNTRVAPFDNVDVRRALNYATDRKALIGLFGGERLATASCQILPPGFPGYQAYCPYTANPGTTWTAPDLAKAQQLVDQSGTKGQKVVVIATPDETTKSIDLYFVSLLKQLGYDASLKTLNGSVEYSYVQDSTNQSQMSYTYWSPDYTAPSNFLAISVGCDGFHEASTASPNLSEFCDPSIDAETKQAEKTQLTDPSAADTLWTQVDHDVTDAAPQITLFTGNKLDFVSSRLGNYQYNPSVTGQFMIDQAWVQ
jgi:peptide/nickel transport system substrate-binding protein